MKRAMELALNGLGKVSPNPLVGCVVVHEGDIVGEGWHEYYGGPHAEVNALNNLPKKVLKKSKVYVTLEPCSHIGKTPPCTNLLIESGVKEVIIGSLDPNKIVNGSGIQHLESSGIKVTNGFMEGEVQEMNRRFLTFHQKERPYVILKWAQTSDGFMARENGVSKWISNEASRRLNHKWRGEEDAIVVGARTAELDDPQLTTRDWSGKNPIRVIFGNPKIHSEANLRDGQSTTWIFNWERKGIDGNLSWIKFGKSTLLKEAMRYFYDNKIQSVIVEGGANTLKRFIKANLWDEARIFTAPEKFGRGIKAPLMNHKSQIEVNINGDILSIARNYG